MTLRRYDLTKTVSGDWSLKEEGALRAIRRFPTKSDAINGGTLAKVFGRRGGSVRIHYEDGTIQEERTYPASADPAQSLGDDDGHVYLDPGVWIEEREWPPLG